MPKRLVGFLAWIVVSVLAAAAHAQGPPIHTDTPIMLGLEGRGVRTFVRALRIDRLLQDGEEIPDLEGREITVYVYPLAVPLNLTRSTQIGVIWPFLTKDLKSNTSDDSRSGFGDTTIFLKQLILQVDRRAETFRVAVKGSTKFPTGNPNGLLPLGSGSVDYGLSAVAGWVKSRWGLYGEGIYVVKTSGRGKDLGNRLAYNLAAGYRLFPSHYTHYPQPQFNLSVELNGSLVDRTEVDGVKNPNTGGSILFFSPGIQYVGGRRWLVEASVQLPLFDEPNGTQLGTNWAASFGTRILIF